MHALAGCSAITFESYDYDLYVRTSGIFPGNTGQVRLWKSSGQGHSYKNKSSKTPIPAM